MIKEPLVIKPGTLFIVDWPNDTREIHLILSEDKFSKLKDQCLKIYNVATITIRPDKEYQIPFKVDDVQSLSYFQNIWEDKTSIANHLTQRERKKLSENCYYSRMYYL